MDERDALVPVRARTSGQNARTFHCSRTMEQETFRLAKRVSSGSRFSAFRNMSHAHYAQKANITLISLFTEGNIINLHHQQ